MPYSPLWITETSNIESTFSVVNDGTLAHVLFQHPLQTPGFLDVIDASGRIVRDLPLANGSDRTSFAVDALDAGIYVIELRAGSARSAQRLIIAR